MFYPIRLLVFLCAFVLMVPSMLLAAEEDGLLEDPGLRTVAIWDFENTTMMGMGDPGEVEYLAKTLPEMILSKVVGIPDLKIVERVQLREVLEEQKLGSSELSDQKSRLKLGRISGARFMVFGNFMAVGPMVQVSVRVVDVETSLMTFVDNKNGPLNDLSSLADSLATNVSRSFSSSDMSVTAFSWKQDMSVWKRQNEGLKLLDERNYSEAILLFEGILKDNPTFLPAKRQIEMARLGDDYKNALALMKSKEYAKAALLFRGILKKNPSFKPARAHFKKALKLKRQAG